MHLATSRTRALAKHNGLGGLDELRWTGARNLRRDCSFLDFVEIVDAEEGGAVNGCDTTGNLHIRAFFFCLVIGRRIIR